MSNIAEALRQLLAVEGVRTAALIDVATGMIVESAGAVDPDLAITAVCAADEARTAREMLGPELPGGDLDEIAVTTAGRLQLSKLLGPHIGEGLLLFVDLDRTKANLALASLRVGQAAPAVLA
jgi:hypothetical protein